MDKQMLNKIKWNIEHILQRVQEDSFSPALLNYFEGNLVSLIWVRDGCEDLTEAAREARELLKQARPVQPEAVVYNIKQVAELLGKTPVAIRKIAARYEEVGQKVGRDWVFTGEDIEKLKAVVRGRPSKKTVGP